MVLEFDSRVLADNPLGDPKLRKLAVWLPPGYDDGTSRGRTAGRGRRYPGAVRPGRLHRVGTRPPELAAFLRDVPERAARLIAERKTGPAILVFPDCFTSMGGNQYVNSSAVGRLPITWPES